MDGDWTRSDSRAEAVFPTGAVRASKLWPLSIPLRFETQ